MSSFFFLPIFLPSHLLSLSFFPKSRVFKFLLIFPFFLVFFFFLETIIHIPLYSRLRLRLRNASLDLSAYQVHLDLFLFLTLSISFPLLPFLLSFFLSFFLFIFFNVFVQKSLTYECRLLFFGFLIFGSLFVFRYVSGIYFAAGIFVFLIKL